MTQVISYIFIGNKPMEMWLFLYTAKKNNVDNINKQLILPVFSDIIIRGQPIKSER